MQHARRPQESASDDRRVLLRDVSWAGYQMLLEMRGDNPRPRISYLEGTVELMSPSRNHDVDKKRLARLLEAWSDEAGIDLDGEGSWTVKKKTVKRGAEADECYVVCGRHRTPPSAPDIVIEVVRSSGGIDKLDVWRLLRAREVWFWEDDALSFHVLRGTHYVAATRSSLLPTLDPALLVRFMSVKGTQPEAVRALRKAMRAKKRG